MTADLFADLFLNGSFTDPLCLEERMVYFARNMISFARRKFALLGGDPGLAKWRLKDLRGSCSPFSGAKDELFE